MRASRGSKGTRRRYRGRHEALLVGTWRTRDERHAATSAPCMLENRPGGHYEQALGEVSAAGRSYRCITLTNRAYRSMIVFISAPVARFFRLRTRSPGVVLGKGAGVSVVWLPG